MIKPFAFLVGVLLLAAMPFAESYSRTYVSGGWLEVTRTLYEANAGECPLLGAGISDVCANSGATQSGEGGAIFTLATLSLRNIGAIDRSMVSIGESLSYVPAGAAISFSPSPAQFDGRQAVWELPEIRRGETVNVTYRFGATVSEAAAGRIPDAAAIAAPSTVMLFAPSRVQLNSTLTISLKSLEGRPISGASIVVGYPDGSRQSVRTDSSGTASLAATRSGSYTYSADGYRLYQMASTIAYDRNAEEEKAPATAASAADAGILPSVLGALPLFAGIFAAAVVALIIYNFLSARREEEDVSGPAPPLAEQQAKSDPGMSYTQKFTFGTEDEHQQNLDDTTRRMVESRKRRMQESEPAPPVEHEEAVPEEATGAARMEEGASGTQEAPADYDSERTVMNGDMDDELAELEKNARIAGEVAEQEKEVENMLAQLEDIRNKLRAGRGQPPEDADAAIDEPVPARKPRAPERAAPARKAAAKPQAKQKPRRK
ncbi:MAG: carboxypeptidase-like regulatory domain-containing protein [Candidatus Micrarchaeia archaeon]|jgi:hypothetical protein